MSIAAAKGLDQDEQEKDTGKYIRRERYAGSCERSFYVGDDMTEEDIETLRSLAQEKKVVAIGEIGLDYYWDNSPREVQKKWFERQLELAREVDLPVIIHIDSQIKCITHTRFIRYTLSGNIIRHTMHRRGIYNRQSCQ